MGIEIVNGEAIYLEEVKKPWWYHASVQAKASSGSRHHQPFNLLNSCDRERLSSCRLTETQASDRTRIQQNSTMNSFVVKKTQNFQPFHFPK